MQDDALSRNIVRETDGWFAAVYGPFALRSAFQPIFRQAGGGTLRLEAFEGLVRPVKAGQPVSPFAFFSSVQPEDQAFVDALCRQLHMLNMGRLARPSATLFLNFDPRLFDNARPPATEANRLADLACRIGLPPRHIVCEITEKKAPNRVGLLAVVEDLRERGFRIAVDDYGAEDSDIARIELLRPDIVKFDGEWVLRYMESRPGTDLLRDAAARFHSNGITTLFEGLEENWQVDLAIELKIDLLQGYALARPDLKLDRFNELFPEKDHAVAKAIPRPAAAPQTHEPLPAPGAAADRPERLAARPGHAPRKTFGRRHR